MRTPLIAGNWKMNKTLAEARELVQGIAEGQSTESKERVVPIPEIAMPDITEAVRESFNSDGFIVLSPDRFRKVQDDWRLCCAGRPWGGRKVCRPWQNRDMVHNALRNTKVALQRRASN